MNKSDKTILVTGATGQQGGATARHLLADGWNVKALTRNPNNPPAKTLEDSGVELVQGDLADRARLDEILNGVYGVFSVQQFWEHGYDGELQQGKILADAAKAASVEHFVYSSVGSADKKTGLPHFDSKWLIEEHIRSLGIKASILRPVFFMENLLMPDFKDNILKGTLGISLKTDVSLQMIAVDDIGAFASLVFGDPDTYDGKAIDLAGDELTGPQMAEALSGALGKDVNFMEFPIEQLRALNEEYAVMFEWFNDYGYEADIPALKKIHPGLKSFKTWLSETSW